MLKAAPYVREQPDPIGLHPYARVWRRVFDFCDSATTRSPRTTQGWCVRLFPLGAADRPHKLCWSFYTLFACDDDDNTGAAKPGGPKVDLQCHFGCVASNARLWPGCPKNDIIDGGYGEAVVYACGSLVLSGKAWVGPKFVLSVESRFGVKLTNKQTTG